VVARGLLSHMASLCAPEHSHTPFSRMVIGTAQGIGVMLKRVRH
jgi:hypothetical protein